MAAAGTPEEARGLDAALVDRVRAGDRAALADLYDRYSRPAYSLARRITGEPAFAEDVVQEVFLALWRDPSRYRPDRGAFVSWVLAATHHKSVDVVRREEVLRRRRNRVAEEAEWEAAVAPGTPAVEETVWVGLRGDRVRGALRRLPEAQREALVLAYYAGYTQREIATLTETPLGTVKTRMLAGMRTLRDLLDEVSDPEEAHR